MAAPRGPRGENVTLIAWTTEDGTQFFELYAASGVRGNTKHKSAADMKRELIEAGVEEHLIIVDTMLVK